MKKLIIAIDGPVGSGKSTVARRVAQLLDYVYIDTGAMYRAVALKALAQRSFRRMRATIWSLWRAIRRSTCARRTARSKFLLDGEDVTSQIRSAEISQAASKVATVSGVRHVLVTEQRRAGHKGGVVMEGRDIGTVVFPDAELKIFLTASAEIRAERRWREHQQKGDSIDLARTLEEIRERDKRDRERTIVAFGAGDRRGAGR